MDERKVKTYHECPHCSFYWIENIDGIPGRPKEGDLRVCKFCTDGFEKKGPLYLISENLDYRQVGLIEFAKPDRVLRLITRALFRILDRLGAIEKEIKSNGQ
jgi:hypothetical protein